MRLEQMKPEHSKLMDKWRANDCLEELTCRPVVDGQRLPSDGKIVTLVYFVVGIDEPVGKFSYFDFNPRNKSAEFGYVVSPSYRKQGIGTDMVAAGLNYLFVDVGLNKAYCQTAAFNVASVKLLEKLDFHKDATLRQHHELNGTFWDDFIYSQLRSEWLNRSNTPPK